MRNIVRVTLKALRGERMYVLCRTKADADYAFREYVEFLVGLGRDVIGQLEAKKGATPTITFDTGGKVTFYSNGCHLDGTTAKRVTLDEFEDGDF